MYTIKVRKRFRFFARKKVIASHEFDNGWLKLISDKGVELVRDVSIRSIMLYPDYYAHLRVKRDQEQARQQQQPVAPVVMQAPVIQAQPRAEQPQQVGWENQYNQEAYRRATERVNGLSV